MQVMIDLSVCVLLQSCATWNQSLGVHRGVILQVAEVARLSTTTDGGTILEVAGQPVFGMNRVAVSIWTKLAAGLSIQEVTCQIAKEYDVREERVASDIAKFIEVLK